jgi:hypothetical protein
VPSRRQIEEHVDALRGEHDGRTFAEAIERYSRGLDESERGVLADVLLDRAGEQGAYDRGRALQQASRGWFRRQLDKLDPGNRPR